MNRYPNIPNPSRGDRDMILEDYYQETGIVVNPDNPDIEEFDTLDEYAHSLEYPEEILFTHTMKNPGNLVDLEKELQSLTQEELTLIMKHNPLQGE